MKYKKGSIVEVLVKGNWRCAQIVSNNGPTYTVSYDVYPGFTNKSDTSQIPVKFIRPCPPLLQISQSWVPGDVVEVFHHLSWKTAIILKSFNWDQFLVRLVGSSQEFEATKFELRVRHSFQNGEWIITNSFNGDGVGDNNSAASSSGSCSIDSCYKGGEMWCGTGGGIGDSDAESFCEMRYDDDEEEEERVELGDEIHRLELDAYRCTMEALHASGPLTWEKETMVTNLRMLLHISNDEHLIQIKNLISSSSNNR